MGRPGPPWLSGAVPYNWVRVSSWFHWSRRTSHLSPKVFNEVQRLLADLWTILWTIRASFTPVTVKFTVAFVCALPIGIQKDQSINHRRSMASDDGMGVQLRSSSKPLLLEDMFFAPALQCMIMREVEGLESQRKYCICILFSHHIYEVSRYVWSMRHLSVRQPSRRRTYIFGVIGSHRN
jgi:hypothetical protein